MTKHDNVSQEGIMKATEFIKKFGLSTTENYADHCVNINDLKRLVESHESVQSHGGLECAKKTVNYPFYLDKPDCGTCYRLSKAIKDVEACHEVN